MAAKKKKSKKSATKPKKAPAKKSKRAAAPKKARRAPAKRAKAKTAKRAKAKRTKAAKKPAMRRFDHAGHLDPKYAKGLRAQSGRGTRSDSTRPAFNVKEDDFAEELGEEVVGKANSGEDEGEDSANQDVEEEVGGPFVVTTGSEEFADGVDESNPVGASREPFPRT